VLPPVSSAIANRTTQHRGTKTNIHDLSRIRTHDPSNQAAKTAATVTGCYSVATFGVDRVKMHVTSTSTYICATNTYS
jgi:hypothetical protein